MYIVPLFTLSQSKQATEHDLHFVQDAYPFFNRIVYSDSMRHESLIVYLKSRKWRNIVSKVDTTIFFWIMPVICTIIDIQAQESFILTHVGSRNWLAAVLFILKLFIWKNCHFCSIYGRINLQSVYNACLDISAVNKSSQLLHHKLSLLGL